MILLSVFLIALTIWIFMRVNKNKTFWRHLMAIPGPESYPLLGNIGDLLIKDGVEGFQRDRELNKRFSPIFRIWFLDVAFVGLSSPEDIELVLSNPIHNNKGVAYDFLHGWLGTGLVTSNGRKWQNRRKILTPAFHFSILVEFANVFNRNIKVLLKELDNLCRNEYIEVNSPVTRFTLNSIGETSMGLNFNDDTRCESYKEAVHKYCHILTERLHKPWPRIDALFWLTAVYKENKKAIEILHDFSSTVIKERQAQFLDCNVGGNKKMAMLDLMLTAKNNGADINDEGIREEVDTFMFGGHDTTATGITYALMALSNEQDIQEEVYKEIIDMIGDSNEQPSFSDLAELKYMERCIKEVLRIYPSVPSIARVAGEDIRTSQGYTIPKGADVAIFIYDLHRNPKVWDDPEKFDPNRFLPENIAKRHPYSYIPFSAGPRNCIVKGFLRDRELARLYNPIYKIWFFNVSYVVIFGPEDAEKLLSNPKHNTKGNEYDLIHDWLGMGLLTSNGTKWQNRRKILTPAFHFSILQEFVSIFNKALEGLLKKLREQCCNDYIEVNKPVTEFTINAIGETSMGLTFNDDSRYEAYRNAVTDYCLILGQRVLKPWLRIDLIFYFSSLYKVKNDALDVLHDCSKRVIKERDAVFKDSTISYSDKKKMTMLDLMLSAKYRGADITDEDIREDVDTFMFGGHDTTASAISQALMVFANEQVVQEEAYQEILSVIGTSNENPSFAELRELKYLERCIKEVLRLYPSAPSISRVAGEDIKTSGGYTIPKGTDVEILIYDLHRNPNIWDDPEKFDPDRFLPENITKRHRYSYIPFSAGPRNCIGQKYAMLEMKAALSGILQTFKLEPADTPKDIQYKIDMVLRPTREIRVKFVPRSNS